MNFSVVRNEVFVVSYVVTQHIPYRYSGAGVKGQIFCFSNSRTGDLVFPPSTYGGTALSVVMIWEVV